MSMDQVPFGESVEFAENVEPRCPCLLLLDTSGSMRGKQMDELNAGIRQLKDELLADEMAQKRVEIAIVGFGPVQTVSDFQTPDVFQPPTLVASGDTPIGGAIEAGLTLLDQRKQVYRTNGVSYYRPWIFLITDGGPTDFWQTAAEKVKQGEAANHFSFFAVGVEGARMDILAQIATREPVKLQELRFRDLFKWLSNSLSAVSKSQMGTQVSLGKPDCPGRLGRRRMNGGWKYAAASVIGTSHLAAPECRIRCQDAHECGYLDGQDVLVCVASDGAGSASHSDQGSRFACEVVVSRIRSANPEEIHSRAFALDTLGVIQETLQTAAQETGTQFRDFACTLLVAIANRERVTSWQIGDGAICFRIRSDADFRYAFWPAKGEYANVTHFVTDSKAHEELDFDTATLQVADLALFSDGLERLALDFRTGEVHSAFFRGLFPYLHRRRPPGRHVDVEDQMKEFS